MDSPDHADEDVAGLSEQQLSVLALIARRLTLKEIAHELEISQGRVAQHVRMLKDRLGSETLSGLAEIYNRARGIDSTPCIKDLTLEYAVPEQPAAADSGDGTEADSLVPEALDGQYGTALRIGYILGVALLCVVIPLLLFAAMEALSSILSEADPR